MSIFRNDGRRKFIVILIIESILIIGLLCALFVTIQDKKSSKSQPKLYSTCNYSTPLTVKDLIVIKAILKKGITIGHASALLSQPTSAYEQNSFYCVSISSNADGSEQISNGSMYEEILLTDNLTKSEQVHVTELVYNIMKKTGYYSKITILKHPQMYG